MATYKEIEKANEEIKPTDIKGKKYAEVNQRIKAFRKINPNGKIVTDIVEQSNGAVIMKTTVYDESDKVIATGMACEKEGSNNINKTSFIENCETSAVGRALGMCGFGIDCAVASKEEVESKEETAARMEKELEKMSVDYVKLRTTLSELGCDFRSEETNAWITNNAKVETQSIEELDYNSLKRLNFFYRKMITAEKDRHIAENNQKIVDAAGELGDFSG